MNVIKCTNCFVAKFVFPELAPRGNPINFFKLKNTQLLEDLLLQFLLNSWLHSSNAHSGRSLII